MSDPFEIDAALTGDARVAREITTKLARALAGVSMPVKVGEIEDDIVKAIAAARSAALEEAAKKADRVRQRPGQGIIACAVADEIAAAIRELKDR